MSFPNKLRRNTPSLDAERESFEKRQMNCIQKAMSVNEAAAKEKHIRSTIMGTHYEKSAKAFWSIVRRLPLSHDPMVAWKFCHVLHKVLREGHANALKDSFQYRRNLKELSKHWKRFSQGYGSIISLYLTALSAKLDFHQKYKIIPGSLKITEEHLEEICVNDINIYFELCVDIFECIETQLILQQAVFVKLDMSRAISQTNSGQCRLAPLVSVILDTNQLYNCAINIMFKLHGCLPSDVLLGHRERFTTCHKGLRKFYHICSNLYYFKRLMMIPSVPDKVPDFLIKSDGNHGLEPVQVMEEPEPVDREPSPEPNIGQLVDTTVDTIFNEPSAPPIPPPDARDQLIQSLRAEIQSLKSEIELMQSEHCEEVSRLLMKIKSLENDLEKMKVMKSESEKEVENLKKRIEDVQTEVSDEVKTQLVNVQKRAENNEELYRKLKQKHLDLVKNHAELLRKNADTKKVTENHQQSIQQLTSEKIQFTQQLEDLEIKLKNAKIKQDQDEDLKRKKMRDLLHAAVDESRDIIQNSMTSLEEEGAGSRKCSAGTLLYVIQQAQSSVTRVDDGFNQLQSLQEIDVLVQALSSFAHCLSNVIENGVATSNMTSSANSDLEDLCRSCGGEAIKYLESVKLESIDSTQLNSKLDEMTKMTTNLLPVGSDVAGGDLLNVVEQEMSATSKAVEEAAKRIETLLNESRSRDSGVHLEVNERILDSCNDLMNQIKVLVMSSKELQNEIVDEGRGASSQKDFYMKNSRWTEGLISAAKAVGWGATMLTDAADNVIQGEGKFEELIVCSNEISASTAQLVAASKVKASKNSQKLTKLKNASHNVNSATGKVVATTNAGREQLDEDKDILVEIAQSISLTQIKRQEMDSQVRVLELEQALQQERLKLGAIRKKHYDLERQKEVEESVEDANNQTNGVEEASSKSLSEKPHIPPKPTI